MIYINFSSIFSKIYYRKGFAYVLFKSPASVKKALALSSTEFGGRKLRVSRVKPESQLKKKLYKTQLATQAKKSDKWTPVRVLC